MIKEVCMEEVKEKLYVKMNDKSFEGHVADYVSCNVTLKPFVVTIRFGGKLLRSTVGLIKRVRFKVGGK